MSQKHVFLMSSEVVVTSCRSAENECTRVTADYKIQTCDDNNAFITLLV